MKRILSCSVLAASALSLANCASEPPTVHHHYYRTTSTRYVAPSKPASVSPYKSANVGGGSPESFEAVTPPSSYSQ